MYPTDLKYTKDHEWVRRSTATEARVGITDYAQKQLGDVVYLELPEVGRTLKQGRRLRDDRVGQGRLGAVLPGGRRGHRGEQRARREARSGQLDPHGAWMIVIKVAGCRGQSDLLDAGQYTELTQ